MHNTLLHAQHSCACTKLLCMHWRGQGPRPGPKTKQARVRPGAHNIPFYSYIIIMTQAKDPKQMFVFRPKILVHAQDSCACTTLLCVINTLVHALEGPGTKAGTQKKEPPRAGPEAFFCWVPALVPGPSSACTRVLCMHKSVVHAQESCACTRILGLKTTPVARLRCGLRRGKKKGLKIQECVLYL